MTWEPVIIALAAAIGTIAPALAALLVTLANGRKLDTIHQLSNGNLRALRAEVSALRAELRAASVRSTTPESHT